MIEKVPPEHLEAYSEMFDQFRRQATMMFLDAERLTIFRDLPLGYQVNAFFAGLLVGAASVLVTATKEERQDFLVAQATLAVPQAFEKAKELVAEATKK